MQTSLTVASLVLLVGAAGLAIGDFNQFLPESAPAVRLSSAYLADDVRSAGDVRLRLDKLGYPAAARVFEPALARDPASSTRWIDEAEVLLSRGDKTRAEYCYRRAAALAPDDPMTLLAVGDFFTTAGKPRDAVPVLANILRVEGGDENDIVVNNVFVYYDRLKVRELNLLDQAIPDAPSANSWLKHLMQGDDANSVRQAWQWLQKKKFDDDRGTTAYVHYMFQKGQFNPAGEDWAAHFAARNDGFPQTTRIFNGGFEYLSTGSELDWRDAGYKGVRTVRDETQRHDGRFSMRIDFTANDNPEFMHFGQVVYAPPGHYRLEAYVRTAGITSSEGVRLRITPYQSSKTLAETDGLTGTNNWTALSAEVNVPPGETMLQVNVVRHRSLRIDNQLTGRAWLDSVRLTPVN